MSQKNSHRWLGVVIAAALAVTTLMPVSASAEVEEVRFSSVAWTGVTIKTELAQAILESIGYETENLMVSVPIAYEAMATDAADVFLGNWMPSMKSIAEPHFENGDVVQYVPNMTGAKYTLAVPSYVAEAGITHFRDLDANKEKFEGGRIYGIEEGNDGNLVIQSMIDNDMFGLGDWKLIPSSEPAMLSQVQGFVKDEQFAVFLGWAPHAMNTKIDMTYLDGSTAETFGPDNGSATIYTNLRAGFAEESPNMARFFKQLEFPVSMMNEIMGKLSRNNSLKPRDAALDWIIDHSELYNSWLDGVSTRNGDKDAVKAFEAFLANRS